MLTHSIKIYLLKNCKVTYNMQNETCKKNRLEILVKKLTKKSFKFRIKSIYFKLKTLIVTAHSLLFTY